MRPILLLSLSLLFLFSCSKYPGYRKLTDGIYFSLVQFGDSSSYPMPGEYVTLDIQYRLLNDSVFFSGIRTIKLEKEIKDISVDRCILEMKEGDSARFLYPVAPFFQNTLDTDIPEFLQGQELMKMHIRLKEIQTESEFQNEKQLFLTWLKELSVFEMNILEKFLKEEAPGIQPKAEGFYMLPIRKGNGKAIQKGNHIWVHYEGKFLNGKFFDGTYRSHEPLDFIYGTQFVLIPGLEEALAYMSEGEKSMVILPSSLAFGGKGDLSGIIPPYTSLIYTLELIRIE